MKLPTIAVMLLGLALGVGRAAEPKSPPKSESGSPCDTPSQGAAGSLKDPFPDVKAIFQDLADRLGRLKEEGKTASTAKLVEQARAEKKASVHTLPDTGKPLDAPTLYARTRPGVVVVFGVYKCPKCQRWHTICASGFVIRSDGLVVTNQHVIDGPKTMEAFGVATHEGQVFPVKSVLAANRRNDLALLEVEGKNLHALPIAAAAPPGTTVYCLSHPAFSGGKAAGFYALSQGIVAGTFSLQNNKQERIRMLAITAEYGPGSSGGPVLNDRGAVVGVACQVQPIVQGERERGAALVWKLARPACDLLELLGAAETAARSSEK